MTRGGGGVAARPIKLRQDWYESVRLISGVAAGLASAVLGVLAGLGWGWAGAVAVGSAVLVWTKVLDGVFARVVDPVRRSITERQQRRKRAREVLYDSTPARVSAIDPYRLDVSKSAAASAYQAADARRPPYVGRAIDSLLRMTLAEFATHDGGVVVVKGHPKAGKSRTLWEALDQPATKHRTLYALRPPDERNEHTIRPLETFLDAKLKINGADAIVWIDDAHEHFAYGLTKDRLVNDLLGRHPGLIVAMTVHTERLQTSPRSEGGLATVDAQLVDYLRELAAEHDLAVGFTDTERADARRLYPGLEETIEDPVDFQRLPAWFAGVSYLRNRYRHGHIGGVAIAKAAIDWRRAGMPAGISLPQLRELAEVELDLLDRAAFTDENFDAALQWAKGEDPDSEPRWKGIALLRPLPGTNGTLWRDFDAVTTWAPCIDGTLDPRSWEVIARHVTPDTAFPVAVEAGTMAPNCILWEQSRDRAENRLRDLVIDDGNSAVAAEIMWITYWELRDPVDNSPIEGRLPGGNQLWRRCARFEHADNDPRLAQDEEDTVHDAWQWVLIYEPCQGEHRAGCRSDQNCYVIQHLLHNSELIGARGEGGSLGQQ